FLASTMSFQSLDVDIVGQGEGPLTLLPDGNTGNYFAETNRSTRRLQWQETFFASPLQFAGQQWVKGGVEFDHTDLSGRFRSNPILIRRPDNSLIQRIDFEEPSRVGRNVNEFMAFVQDKWVPSPKLTIDAGLRFDHDGTGRQNNISPRLSFMLIPIKNGRTIIRGGVGMFYDRIPLSVGYFEELPERVVTTFAPDGVSITDSPIRFNNVVERPLSNPRSVRWSLQLDRGITTNLRVRAGYLSRSTADDLIVNPRVNESGTGSLTLGGGSHSQYREVQLVAAYDNPRVGSWNASYAWSRARGDLNTSDNFLGDLPEFVVRTNEYGPLSFDVPHRFIAFGRWKARYDITVSPALEVRSGFPFSHVNAALDYVGGRNQAGRFPTYISLDAQVTKGFAIPRFERRRARVGIAVFNITNRFNPRDVQSNLESSHVGQFFNSLGASVRGKFELEF
ncbi:MAG TPA: TonB-dependent receptor, partial [Blastocatellia bacterium]|nr:TonB-dependent receptor [Blastocatellia bacterium]